MHDQPLQPNCPAAPSLPNDGGTMRDIVDLTSFHTDMRDLQVFMRVKDRYLTEDFPAWTAIGAAQLGGAAGYLIEIKAVAVLER